MNLDFIDTYASALAAILGGIGVKIIEKLLSRRSEKFNEAKSIREELRQEIISLREELETWRNEAEEWRNKYYDKVEINLKMISEIEGLRAEIRLLQDKINSLSNGFTEK